MRRHALAPPFLALSFAILCGLGPVAGSGSSSVDIERLLAQSNHPSPPPYRALRRMEGGLTDDGEKRGWLEALTEYRPGKGLRYEIVGEGGSEYVRNKILRSMLATEQELLATGKRLRASLEAKNYEFADDGVTADGLRRVALKPLKKSDGILHGRLFLDPSSQLLTRMEGRLVKSPSFWLRDVDVTWNFAEIGGHLVPIEMISSGRVRIFGRSNFRMVYKYQSIGGRAVSETEAASNR
jgi:hypothetical protein